MEWFCVTFVIDLDNVCQWLGFSQKVKAKTLLEKNYVIDKDYKTLLLPNEKQKSDGRGGHNKETFLYNYKRVFWRVFWCIIVKVLITLENNSEK